MSWLTSLTGVLAPVFLVLSPILSYGDQAYSMHRKRTSAGFSLDIPLIMLVASFLRICYWPGARFDTSLLLQSILMVAVQATLLKIALDHRPPPSSKGGEAALPFAGAGKDSILDFERPFNFWKWRSPKPYWKFLVWFAAGLLACEMLLKPAPQLYNLYSSTIGVMGLSIEATLPIPQILANAQSRSCKGFRVSVLASWILGDTMKLFWFFTTTTEIPPVFKICGMFQAACDAFLGVQYLMYGEGEQEVKEHPMVDASWKSPSMDRSYIQNQHSSSRSSTPTRPRRSTVTIVDVKEKELQ
ncbi:unnamed protein product [Clonostachys byssicola]|uniref:PQ-loop repeat-containing protein 1 n=1 Tax=Clonostachys byssicola TaxID=160290 RepID=A0A9N9UUT6_9HYPO|nr:unnamed protein product [Clonostachys byssicola]